jgi:hypothetical protein
MYYNETTDIFFVKNYISRLEPPASKALNMLFDCNSVNCRSQWLCGLRRRSWPVCCWDRGFESRSRHGCLSASFCAVLSCVGKRPCDGLITRPLCLNSSRNLLYVRRPRSFKDCRATEKKCKLTPLPSLYCPLRIYTSF